MDKNSNKVYFKKCNGQKKIEANQLTGNANHLITYLQQDPDYRDQEIVIEGCDRSIYHPRGEYELRLQCDGNLVIKKHEDGFVHDIWRARDLRGRAPQGRPKDLVMQRDGNLVVYREDGQAMWASNTIGDNYSMVLQGDGNLAIYDNKRVLSRDLKGGSVTMRGNQYYDKPIMWNHFTDRPNK